MSITSGRDTPYTVIGDLDPIRSGVTRSACNGRGVGRVVSGWEKEDTGEVSSSPGGGGVLPL